MDSTSQHFAEPPSLILQLLLRNVHVLRGVLLLTPETCVVKSEAADGLFSEAWDEAAFDRSLRERLGCVLLPLPLVSHH